MSSDGVAKSSITVGTLLKYFSLISDAIRKCPRSSIMVIFKRLAELTKKCMQFDFHKAHARQRPLGGLLNIIQTCPQKRDESGTGAVAVSHLLQCEILTIE